MVRLSIYSRFMLLWFGLLPAAMIWPNLLNPPDSWCWPMIVFVGVITVASLISEKIIQRFNPS